MAVSGIAKELRDGNETSQTLSGKGVTRVSERRYVRTFLVRTTDSKDPAPIALTAPGLPFLGQAYVCGKVFDPLAHCVSLTPERKASKIWYVKAEYSTETPEDAEVDPLHERPIMTFGFHTFQIPVMGTRKQVAAGDEDEIFIDPMKNTAGQIFDPPAMMDDSRPVLRITRNEPEFIPTTAIYFQDAVNSIPWAGAKRKQAKIIGISTTGRQTEKRRNVTYVFYPVTYEIHFKRETWDIRVLNAGRYYLNAAGADPTVTTNLIEFKSHAGQGNVGLLAADGTKLANGAKAQWVRRAVYKELTFQTLNLPETFR